MSFQRRSWRVQRVARGVVFLLVLAALAGLFGGGGIAPAEAHSADGALSVQYHRFGRNHADAELTLRARPKTPGAALRIWISQESLRAAKIERITPAPLRSELAGDRVIFDFAVEAQTSDWVEIMVHCRTRQSGIARGAIGLVGGSEARFWQFVFP